MAKYCPSCGSEVSEGASFCIECGADIGAETAPEATDTNQEPSPPDTASEEPVSTADTGESGEPSDDESRNITVGWIAGYLVGALTVLVGLAGLLISATGGLLLILVGLFSMPYPRAKFSDSAGVSFSRALVVVIVVVGFIAGFAVLGASIPSEESASSGTPESSSQASGGADAATPTSEPTVAREIVHARGETFTVGSGESQIQYRVTQATVQQTAGSGFSEVEADGVFVVIDLTMVNTGSESLQLSSRVFRLVDDQDREYETDSDAVLAYEDNVVYEQLDPGVEKQATIVFDVPADQSGRQLKIQPAGVFSGADDHYVDLGTL